MEGGGREGGREGRERAREREERTHEGQERERKETISCGRIVDMIFVGSWTVCPCARFSERSRRLYSNRVRSEVLQVSSCSARESLRLYFREHF